jgi:hypothetical protein
MLEARGNPVLRAGSTVIITRVSGDVQLFPACRGRENTIVHYFS